MTPAPGRHLGRLLALLATVFGAGCATTLPAVPVPEGSRILVRLYDGRQGIELALANASHPELQGAYSRPRTHAALKLAPDELVGELLASLDRGGLEQFGRPGDEPPEPRGFLLVRRDEQQRVFAEPDRSAPAEERQAFARIKLLMDHYYQHVGALQFVDNPAGARLFETERGR